MLLSHNGIELMDVEFTGTLSLGSEEDKLGRLPGIASGIMKVHNADRRREARARDHLISRSCGRQRSTWKRATGARRTFIEQLYRFDEASHHPGGPQSQSQESMLEKSAISGSSGALACAYASKRIGGFSATSRLVCTRNRHDVHEGPGFRQRLDNARSAPTRGASEPSTA
ncbi:hypothetical protein HJFPF1_10176 [Paramyrothecium foliicola]|nr:hypothetical protein HJFPF1_10176 [Paramyrothecium foliicola]